MPIKCLRLQIVKPIDATWDEFGKVLSDLRYFATKSANFVIQKLYMWEFYKSQHKEQYGTYPDKKEHHDKWYWYNDLRSKYPAMAGQMANQIGRHAEKVFTSRKKDIMCLRQSVPSFKLNFPICIHNSSYKIKLDDGTYAITANLLSKVNDKTSYAFIILPKEPSKRAILDRLISGEYKKGAMQIVSDRKKKWYVILPYEFKPLPKQLSPDKIMGIDLGVANAVYWAFNDSLKRGCIPGKEIDAFRRKVQQRRKDIQRQGRQDVRQGRGRKHKLHPVDVLSAKERNFRATTNHRYAKKIVDIAVQSGCGTIQMEDLAGIGELSTFLKNWTYFDLQTKIITKAADAGITVIKIDPAYTSQRCHECGHIDKDNRPDQATFICQECGSTCHADYNAARNIATKCIHKIIKKEIAKKEIL